MPKLDPILQGLGLTAHEASVYEVLLTQSPASATFIAKKCQMSRSSVYTLLSSLIGKGLVGTTYRNTVKQFVAEDESALEEMLKREKEQVSRKADLFATLREALKETVRSSMHIPQVVSFEGQAGFKKAYLAMMRSAAVGSTLLLLRDEFVWEKDWNFIFGQDWHERIKRLKVEKGIRTQLLTNRSKLELAKKPFYRARKGTDHRFLPVKQNVERFALYILGEVVTILSFEDGNLVGVKIVNRLIAQNFVQLFKLLWAGAKG